MLSRFWNLFRRKRLDREFDAEVRYHMDSLEAEYRDRGLSADEAYREARRDFGGVVATEQAYRDQRGIPMLETLCRDVRFSLRSIRRTPTITLAVIATLAIAIGANTTIFSVVNGVLIQPLPYPDPNSLVGVWHTAQFQGITSNNVRLSSTMYLAYREHNKTFQHFGLWHSGAASVTGIGDPEEVRTLVVTYETLPAIGVQPAIGRWFSAADDTPATQETVILSYGYWQRRLGADPAVLGRMITIDSRSRQVIGVMPRRFQSPQLSFITASDADVILPQRFEANELQPNDFHAYVGIARLKPGVSLAEANADVARMLPIWIDEYGTNGAVLTAARFAPALRPLKQDVIGDIGKVLWLLMGTIGIVLLIACANVANLMLVRTDGRHREITVRTALGAGSFDIARQLLIESIILGLSGGVIGLMLAYSGLRFLVAVSPGNLPRLTEVSVDAPVLLFTFGVSVASGLLFGLIPVVRYFVRDSNSLGDALRAGGRTLSHSRERSFSRNALVIAQVALAVVLLVAAGLMIRSFLALRNVQPGFVAPAKIQTVRISIPDSEVVEPERTAQMQHDIVERIGAIPGVTSVSFSTALPMETEFENNIVLTAEDKTYDAGIPPLRRSKSVAPDYFRTLGTPLLAGRDFTWSEIHDNRAVAIVSENMAREMWGEPSAALGKRIRIGRVGIWNEIVGVVGNVYDSGVDQPAPPIVYWRAGVQKAPGRQNTFILRETTFAIRSDRAETDEFVKRISEAIWAVNPNLPLARVQTMAEIYDRSMSRSSFTLVMLAIAGFMALALGIVGIYGVISYGISQRTREVGIRIALGAKGSEVQRLFLRQGLAITAIGIVAGTSAALALTRWMSSLLFGVSPFDLITYAAVSIILILAAGLASYLPSVRTTRVNPIDSLRTE
jgi:predicted permease